MAEYLNNNVGMDWDDVLENDGQEYIILPEGDYNFEVTDFERGHFPGSAKMAPSNKATLTLKVVTKEGVASVRTDLILNRLVEFKIAAFFRCIGEKKHGEKLRMNWQAVPGSTGRLRIGHRTYNGKEYNQVARYLEPAEPAVQKKFTPGSF